jgi:hypothetical protein
VVAPPVYVYGGDDYCWFERGWNGAGWYVCDYGPWIKGAWWGGPAGWNGWVWRGGPRFYDRPYGRRFGYGPPRGYPRGGYGFRRDFADGRLRWLWRPGRAWRGPPLGRWPLYR